MKVFLYLMMALLYAVAFFFLLGSATEAAGKLFFIDSAVFGCFGTVCGIGASLHDKMDRVLRHKANGAPQ